MKYVSRGGIVAALMVLCAPIAAFAGDPLPGASVQSLLEVVKERNPDYAGMRYEAAAADERVASAGALPDPKLRVELMDITRMGEQNPTLLPGNVGSTRYLVMQEIPWFGKRQLMREAAQFEAQGAQAKVAQTWSELSARVKTAQAQRFFLYGTEKLTREILDLMVQLEQIAQARYASGLAAQQDVIRAQVEQTNMKTELVALESDGRQLDVRMNALLARPPFAALARPAAPAAIVALSERDYFRLEQRVRQGNPMVRTTQARVDSTQKSRELTYKNRYPDFAFGISPTQSGSAIKEWSLMLEVNIPLQQSSRRSQEREAEAMVAAAQSRWEDATNQALAELSQNLAAIDAAGRTEKLLTTSLLPQAELTFSAALASYETGKVDFATLLEAQRQIQQARQNVLKAQTESQVRLAEIEKLLGEPL